MPIRAVIFDFDGLILDTETPELLAWQELYSEHGCSLPMDLWVDCIGRPHGHFDPYAHLIKLAGRPLDREALRQRRRARTQELILHQDAMPGVRQWLQDAQAIGLRIGIASSSNRNWVVGHLERLGLAGQFQQITCSEDTGTHKPDPAPYLHALKALGISADAAIALEDSPNGIKAAKAAGLFTVAVPNPVTGKLDLSEADLLVPSLQALPLADLRRAVQGSPRCSAQTP